MRIINNLIAAILLLMANFIEIYFVWLVIKRPETEHIKLFLVHFIAAIVVAIALLISRLKYKQVDNLDKNRKKAAFIVDDGENEPSLDGDDYEIVRHPILLPAFTMCFFIPIFGVFIATFLSIWMKPVDGEKSEVFQDYVDYIRYNPSKRPRFSKIDIDAEIFNNLEIEPVSDLLRTGERTIIWGSVENLSKRSDKIAVRLIRQTMSKNDMDVKYLSSLSLDKIEAKYSKQIDELKEQIIETNEEKDYENIFTLIDQFYNCGILPDELAIKLIEDSFNLLDTAISSYPLNNEIIGYRGRFLKYYGQINDAFKLFSNLYQSSSLPIQFYLDAAEMYANRGQIDKTVELMNLFTGKSTNQKYLDISFNEIELDDLRAFWIKNEVLHA